MQDVPDLHGLVVLDHNIIDYSPNRSAVSAALAEPGVRREEAAEQRLPCRVAEP